MMSSKNYYGWVLKSQTESGVNWFSFYSSEDTTASNRPYLEITYTQSDGQFLYRREITIDYSKLGASCLSDHTDLTDFPVLISITGDSNLKSRAYNGHVESSSGYDITFRSGADQKTQLYHEIESYSPSAGNLVAWVKVPTIKHDQNTTIYMYYGNPSMTSAPPAGLAQGVWDSSYLAVWHLKENPTLDNCDPGTHAMCNSKSTSYHGDMYGSMTSNDQVSGRINGSLDLKGTDDRIQVGTIVGDRSAFAVSLWFKTTSTSLTKIWSESKTGSSYPVMYLSVNENATGDVEFGMSVDNSVWGYVTYTPPPGSELNDGNWHHLVGVQSSKSSREFFVDGSKRGATDTTTVGSFSANNAGNIGAIDRTSVMFFLTGGIDEVRI